MAKLALVYGMRLLPADEILELDEAPIKWRKQIRRAFDNKTLMTANAGITAWECKVEPQAVIVAGLFRENNVDVGAMLIRCWTNEDRYQRGQNE